VDSQNLGDSTWLMLGIAWLPILVIAYGIAVILEYT